MGEGGIVDVAEMPGLIRIPGNVFFLGKIAENEPEFGKVLMNFSESFGFGNHCVVVADDFAIFDEKDVDGEAGVMLGAADGGEILFTVFFAIFNEPAVPDVLLLLKRAINAVELDLDTFFFEEIGAEGFKRFESLRLDDIKFAEGVFPDAETDHIRPIVGKFVLLVDEDEIGVVEDFNGDFSKGDE